MAKSKRLGMGGRFAAMKRAIMRSGKSAKAAAAITASAGRKKYGKKRFQGWAAKGRKRAARARRRRRTKKK